MIKSISDPKGWVWLLHGNCECKSRKYIGYTCTYINWSLLIITMHIMCTYNYINNITYMLFNNHQQNTWIYSLHLRKSKKIYTVMCGNSEFYKVWLDEIQAEIKFAYFISMIQVIMFFIRIKIRKSACKYLPCLPLVSLNISFYHNNMINDSYLNFNNDYIK